MKALLVLNLTISDIIIDAMDIICDDIDSLFRCLNLILNKFKVFR